MLLGLEAKLRTSGARTEWAGSFLLISGEELLFDEKKSHDGEIVFFWLLV